MAADDLSLDLEELRHLQSIAKRPRVVSLISSEIRTLEKVNFDITIIIRLYDFVNFYSVLFH